MRLDDSALKLAAKRLIGAYATLWHHVTDELRDALVDSEVMNAIRLADEDGLVTPAQLLDFRARLVTALTEGVYVGRTRRGLTFDRDRDARRERLAYEAGAAGVEPPLRWPAAK